MVIEVIAMDRRQKLLVELFNSPDMRRFFPNEPKEPADSELFRIFEQSWPIVRETSASDEECVESINTLIHIAVDLADSGRLYPGATL